MSLGFKRVISSIMAFVMMVSTLVMVNVTGVMAGTVYTLDLSSGYTGKDNNLTANMAKQDVFTVLSGNRILGSKKTDTTAGLNDAIGLRFTANGKIDSDAVVNAVQIDVTADQLPANVSVIAMGGSSDKTVGVDLYQVIDSSFKSVDTLVTGLGSNVYGSGSAIISEAGTYYLARTGGGTTNLYMCTVETNYVDTETVTYIATGTIAGLAPDATFTLTNEEGTTFNATVTATGAMSHNFTADGDTDADGFFTIEGTVTELKEPVVVDGVTYSKGLDMDDGSVRGDAKITFTVPDGGASLKIITSGGNDNVVKIEPEVNGTDRFGTDGEVYTLEGLVGGTTYTLTRNTNGYVLYLELVTGSSEGTTEATTAEATEETTASEMETTDYKLSLNVEAGAGVASSTDIGLKVNGTSVTAMSGETTDIVADLAENGTYVLTFTHPEHIYAWSDDLKTTLDSDTLTYTVPADISGDVTLELIYDTGKRYIEDSNDNAPVGMQFGRYGIGDYKVSINDGNDALKYLDYKTLEFNLADIAAGRYNLDGASDTAGLPDQRLLLGNGDDQHITFKIETSETTDNVLVYLDVSGVDVTVSSEDGSASLTSIDGKTVGNKLTGLRSGSGVKAMFYAKNGTYVITADAGNVPAAVKSIRIFQMDNKATDVVADIIDSNTAITNYEITDAAEGTVFARIIGTLNTKDSDELDGIEAIGVTFVDADSVDAYEVVNDTTYDPNSPTSGDTAVDVIGSQDVTTVYKGVYDAATYDSSKVDEDGYYTGDVDTRTPDGSNSYFEMLVYSAQGQRVYAYTYTKYTDSDLVSYRMSGSDGKAVRAEINFGTATAE